MTDPLDARLRTFGAALRAEVGGLEPPADRPFSARARRRRAGLIGAMALVAVAVATASFLMVRTDRPLDVRSRAPQPTTKTEEGRVEAQREDYFGCLRLKGLHPRVVTGEFTGPGGYEYGFSSADKELPTFRADDRVCAAVANARSDRARRLDEGLPVPHWPPADRPPSSCPDAAPVYAGAGDGLPPAGQTDRARVAALLRAGRDDLLRLFPGAGEALVVPRRGQVWTGVQGSLPNPVVDADDAQIQVLIGRVDDCPGAPPFWQGVPLVFTTVERSGIAPPPLEPTDDARLYREFKIAVDDCMSRAGVDLEIQPTKGGDQFILHPNSEASSAQLDLCSRVAEARRQTEREALIEEKLGG